MNRNNDANTIFSNTSSEMPGVSTRRNKKEDLRVGDDLLKEYYANDIKNLVHTYKNNPSRLENLININRSNLLYARSGRYPANIRGDEEKENYKTNLEMEMRLGNLALLKIQDMRKTLCGCGKEKIKYNNIPEHLKKLKYGHCM